MIYKFVKGNNLIVSINKVKSHSKYGGNDMADQLYKMGYDDKDKILLNIDNDVTWNIWCIREAQ